MGIPYAEVIGDPIAHSKSPLIHQFWLEKLGLPYQYRATQVSAGDLSSYLDQRNFDPDWCGCSVAMPLKERAAGLVSELIGSAKSLNLANCITRIGRARPRLLGHNTDVPGFLEPLRPWLAQQHEMRLAYIIGTGGAAAAAAYALDRHEFTVVSVGRDRAKLLGLRQRLSLFDDDLVVDLSAMRSEEHSEWDDRDGVLDLLVNATPLGMTGFPELGINLQQCAPGTMIYDMVYDPPRTALLQMAQQLGMTVLDGFGMLMGQAAVAFELLFSDTAPREHDAELRELLNR